MKNFPKITAVETAESGDIFHGDVVLKILLDERDCLFDIKVTHSPSLEIGNGSAGFGEIIQEQEKMSNQMEGGIPENAG